MFNCFTSVMRNTCEQSKNRRWESDAAALCGHAGRIARLRTVRCPFDFRTSMHSKKRSQKSLNKGRSTACSESLLAASMLM